MHKLLAIFFTIIALIPLDAQDFCGVIKYKYIYLKGKNGKDITHKTKEVKTEEFYICGSRFKTYFDGKLSEIMIADSLTYFLVKSDSTVSYIKADSAYGDRKPAYGKIIDEIVYKGKIYKTLEERDKKELTTYYFNDSIKINPELFKEVELYYWNKYFEATNGSLRLVGINKQRRIICISEAVEIVNMKPGEIDFTFPTGYEIEFSNYFKVFN